MIKVELPKFSIKQLLEAGVHFGHKSMRCNPKMNRYLHGTRNGVSIINLSKSAQLLHKTMEIVKDVAKNNGKILFVGTKKQAAPAIAQAAKRCGQYYVNSRWLGGMLTNWSTVSQSIKTFKKIESQLQNDEIGLKKKEKLMLERKRQKLDDALGGIKHIGGYPDLMFVIDTNKEDIAISEAQKLNIPIAAVVDSNSNPDGINYPIPGNDDSSKAIRLYCRLLSDAILAGIRENLAASGLDVSKIDDADIPAILAPKEEVVSERKRFNRNATPAGEESQVSTSEEGAADAEKRDNNKKKKVYTPQRTAEAAKGADKKRPAKKAAEVGSAPAKKPAAKKPAAKK